MVCLPSSGPRIWIRGFPWENFTQTVSYTIPRYLRAQNLGDLVWVVRTAEDRGQRVKAVGSGWSIENIATSEDWVVNTDALNRRLSYLVDRPPGLDALTEHWRRRQRSDFGERLVHVEAGIKIIDLNRMLEREGLAMLTLGGAQGQTLAGAFSTSTHGSDIRQPPLPGLVKAVHLVTTGGQEVWIESSTQPITDDDEALLRVLPCADTRIIRDDEALNAVVVGLGRFGIIYSCVVKVTGEFRLSEWTQSLPWADVKARLLRVVGLDLTVGANPLATLNTLLDNPPFDLRISVSPVGYRYLDLAFNPRKGDNCWVRRRWLTRHDGDINLEAGDNVLCHPTMGNLVLFATASFLDAYALGVGAIPFVGPLKVPDILFRAAELHHMALDPHMTGGAALAAAANAVWASEFLIPIGWIIDEINQIALSETFSSSSNEGKRGPSWQVTSGTTESAFDRDCYNGSSVEVIFGMDTRAYIDFIDEVLANSNRFRQLGYVSVRFSRRSSALLSMHNVGYPLACSIEVTSADGLADSARWLAWLERRAKEMGGRPHWGQMNTLRTWEVMGLYGDNLTAWRDQLMRMAGSSPTFSNDYTLQRGLEPAFRRRHVTAVRRVDGAITHLCNEGAFWSPVPIEEAIVQIMLGRATYFVTAPDGSAEQNLVLRRFVSTSPDESPENNLQALPERSTMYGPPAPELLERQVTSVMRTDDVWQTIQYLCNDEQRWCVHYFVVFSQIQAGTHTYFIEPEGGTRAELIDREFLTTQADATERNNLGEQPEC